MVTLDMINETTVKRHLSTAGLPDPDVLIRTSGEKRVRSLKLSCHVMSWESLTCIDIWFILSLSFGAIPSLSRQTVSSNGDQSLNYHSLNCQVSNFLLFQMAYTELFFVDKLWPEVTKEDVLHIFHEYHRRERRWWSLSTVLVDASLV